MGAGGIFSLFIQEPVILMEGLVQEKNVNDEIRIRNAEDNFALFIINFLGNSVSIDLKKRVKIV
jgi:hypothetical protein